MEHFSKLLGSLRASRLTMNANLTGKANDKDAGKALIIAYSFAAFGLMLCLAGVGILLACWGYSLLS